MQIKHKTFDKGIKYTGTQNIQSLINITLCRNTARVLVIAIGVLMISIVIIDNVPRDL